MSARIPENVTKSAPGEWVCGDYVAWYDEHLRAYLIFDQNDVRVGIVKRLTSFARWVEAAAPAADAA